jgi:hypothetical protein
MGLKCRHTWRRKPWLWFYARSRWDGPPFMIGSEEHGRCTVVAPVPGGRVVISIPTWIHRCLDVEPACSWADEGGA